MDTKLTLVHRNPDVHRVLVPFDGPGIAGTNCYIVQDGANALVVDAGAPGDESFAVMDRALDELGVDRSSARFFLTHFHTDHSGLLDRIAPPEAPVYVNGDDLDHMRRVRTKAYREELFERLRLEGVPAHELRRYRNHTVSFVSFDAEKHEVVRVQDGDEIPCGRWVFKVVGTPGHTVGHQSLYHPESGLLFGGDLVLFVISSSVDFSPHGADGLQCYLDSIDKVLGLPATKLLHSHGDVQDGWQERAAWLKEHRIDRLEDALRAVAAEDGSTGYEALRRIAWNVPFDTWEEISLTQRWCIIGEGLGYLDHLVRLGQIEKATSSDGLFRYRASGSCGARLDRTVLRSEGRSYCLARPAQ